MSDWVAVMHQGRVEQWGTPAVRPARVGLAGTIVRQAFLGHLMRYWVQIDGDEWMVDQADPGAVLQQLRGPVTVWLNPERIHVIWPTG